MFTWLTSFYTTRIGIEHGTHNCNSQQKIKLYEKEKDKKNSMEKDIREKNKIKPNTSNAI